VTASVALKPLDILLVEDNPADVLFLQKALTRLSTPTRLRVATTGEEALAVLDAIQDDLFDLIFLDLNLPGLHGLELLEHIKHREHARDIPVLILTSSNTELDIQRAHQLGASQYLLKPPTLSGLYSLLQQVEERWLKSHEQPE
jgi:two-component system, chemotaxis family, response regulator Rcp1